MKENSDCCFTPVFYGQAGIENKVAKTEGVGVN